LCYFHIKIGLQQKGSTPRSASKRLTPKGPGGPIHVIYLPFHIQTVLDFIGEVGGRYDRSTIFYTSIELVFFPNSLSDIVLHTRTHTPTHTHTVLLYKMCKAIKIKGNGGPGSVPKDYFSRCGCSLFVFSYNGLVVATPLTISPAPSNAKR